MRPVLGILVLLTIHLAWSSAAQMPGTPPPTRPLPPLVEKIEVSVVNLEVIVTDRSGKRVTGLTKDDFEIFENGKRQAITNFYEVGEPPRTTETSTSVLEAPARKTVREPVHLAILVDEYSLNRSSRDRVLEQLRSFVDSTLTKEDRAMVAVWNMRLSVPVPFTSDRAPVLQALAGVGQGLGPGDEHLRDSMQRKSERLFEGDAAMAASKGFTSLGHEQEPTLATLETTVEVRRKSAAVRSVIRRMAGLEGRKILIFLTQRMPVCAIDDADLCDPMHDLKKEMERMSDAANAEDVILYTLYAAPNEPDPETFSLVRPMKRDQNSLASLNSIARATGGLSATGPDFTSYLAELKDDLDSWYSLGYRATRGSDDRTRKVRVATRNRDYVVRTRAEVVDKSAEDQVSDQLVADLLNSSESPSDSIPFEVKLGKVTPQSRSRFLVRALVHIPVANLTFIQQDGRYSGGFFVHLVSVDGRGDISEVTRKHHRMDVPLTDLDQVRGSTFLYELDVLIDKRGRRLAFALVDEISGESGTKLVDLPPL